MQLQSKLLVINKLIARINILIIYYEIAPR